MPTLIAAKKLSSSGAVLGYLIFSEKTSAERFLEYVKTPNPAYTSNEPNYAPVLEQVEVSDFIHSKVLARQSFFIESLNE